MFGKSCHDTQWKITKFEKTSGKHNKKGTEMAREMKHYVLKKITTYTCNVGTKTATSDKDGDKILDLCSCIAT
jgi:hypothetical protein